METIGGEFLAEKWPIGKPFPKARHPAFSRHQWF
jgi:hypothetical protein